MQKSYSNLMITFSNNDPQYAERIGDICKDASLFIKETLGKGAIYTRVNIVKSPYDIFPISYDRLLLPIVSVFNPSTWKYSPAWAMCHSVFIKTLDGIQKTDKSRYELLFNNIDFEKRLRNLICHELTHAITRDLKLPLWLSEGVSVFVAEKFVDTQTIKIDTLNCLKLLDSPKELQVYFTSKQDTNDVIPYLKGYWATRYLFENNFELLYSWLQTQKSESKIIREISSIYKINGNDFWPKFGTIIYKHYLPNLSSI